MRKKILITGFSGFVARHFIKYMYDIREDVEICGIDIKEPLYDYMQYSSQNSIKFKIVNLLERNEVKNMLTNFEPNYILHLASYSSVAYSWENPVESFTNNTNIFLNLVSTVREVGLKCRILSVGSSEEYGKVKEVDIPLKEEHILNPINPYAVARVSQEMLSKVFVESYGLDIILTRSFNHIGPWQDERFVVPSFIRKIKKIRDEGKRQGTIETGDVDIVRDFVDVRDVVRAYWKLLLYGKKGEIYNICSGKGIQLKKVIELIAQELDIEIQIEVNEKLIRPQDNPVIVGTADKIKNALNWTLQYDMQDTLKAMIQVISLHGTKE